MPTLSKRTQPYAWATSSWFGPLVGCTLWMLVLAGLVWPHDATAGVTALAAFLIANALGVALWSRRATLNAGVALQVQLGVIFLLAIVVMTVADQRVGVEQLEGGYGSRQAYGVLVLYPVLMFVFWMRDRAARLQG